MQESINPKNQPDNPNPWERLQSIGDLTQGGPNLAGLLASVEKFIAGMHFPASKQDILEHIRSLGAPKEALQLLQQIEPRIFSSPEDVARDAGKR